MHNNKVTKKWYISWEQLFADLRKYDSATHVIYGVPKGGMILTAFLQNAKVTHDVEKATLILDDIEDSGATHDYYFKKYPEKQFKSLYRRKDFSKIDDQPPWIVFPWEKDHPAGEETVDQNLVRILQYIGEDPKRPGLKDTPARIVKSWNELFSGYAMEGKIDSLLTTFPSENHDEIILLKNIELYSMCEHHMIPFYGKAHVAYIPGENEIVGISKLARIVDVYARRLQIQERIGDQVTSVLMDKVKARAAACVIEARHMCMCMRGVNKQNSTMITSSMKGLFMTEPSAKAELMQLIK